MSMNIIRKVVDVKAINQPHYLVHIIDSIIYNLFIFQRNSHLGSVYFAIHVISWKYMIEHRMICVNEFKVLL